jgi:hypothetical protein
MAARTDSTASITSKAGSMTWAMTGAMTGAETVRTGSITGWEHRTPTPSVRLSPAARLTLKMIKTMAVRHRFDMCMLMTGKCVLEPNPWPHC